MTIDFLSLLKVEQLLDMCASRFPRTFRMKPSNDQGGWVIWYYDGDDAGNGLKEFYGSTLREAVMYAVNGTMSVLVGKSQSTAVINPPKFALKAFELLLAELRMELGDAKDWVRVSEDHDDIVVSQIRDQVSALEWAIFIIKEYGN